jgi:hypothetical protein
MTLPLWYGGLHLIPHEDREVSVLQVRILQVGASNS